MKQIKNLILGTITIVLIIFILGMGNAFGEYLSGQAGQVSPDLGGRSNVNSFSQPVTNGATTTKEFPTNVEVLAHNPDRVYAKITNDSGTVVYIGLTNSTTESLLNEGIRLDANGGNYEINPNNLYLSTVMVTSTAANLTVTFVEK